MGSFNGEQFADQGKARLQAFHQHTDCIFTSPALLPVRVLLPLVLGQSQEQQLLCLSKNISSKEKNFKTT